MALESLMSGLFGIAQEVINFGINESTNLSNEKNVAATNTANIQMTKETNAANKQIAQETNASNERIMRETNQFNAAQADLAYQRSTSAAKVGELISAGLTPEQARQVIASQGLTGSPTAASGTPIPAQGATMQSPHVEAFQKSPYFLQNLPSIGQNLGNFAKSIIDAANDPTGGTIGQLTSMKEFAKASDIISEVPITALKNPYSFFSWMTNDVKPDSNWGKLISSPSFQKMWDNPISRKSFMYNMQQWYGQAANEEYNLEQKRLQNQLLTAQQHAATIEANLMNAQIFKTNAETTNIESQTNLTNYKSERESILLERDKKLKSLITDTQKAQYAKELADAQLQQQLITDPDYRNAYFASTIGNLSAAAAEYSFVKYKYSLLTGAYEEGMLDDDTIKVFTMLEDLGFEGTSTYESMLQSVIESSNLTTYLMGRGWKFPFLLPQSGSIDSKSDFYNSLKNWNVNIENIRYDAAKPFLKREDIRFGVELGVDFLNKGLDRGADIITSLLPFGGKEKIITNPRNPNYPYTGGPKYPRRRNIDNNTNN